MHHEIEPPLSQYTFPLSLREVTFLKPKDTIARIPASLFMRKLFARVPAELMNDRNAYGEMGGDLLQHGNRRAMSLAIQGVELTATVVKVNREQKKITLRSTLPTYGNEKLWGSKPERTIVVAPTDLIGFIEKIKLLLKKDT